MTSENLAVVTQDLFHLSSIVAKSHDGRLVPEIAGKHHHQCREEALSLIDDGGMHQLLFNKPRLEEPQVMVDKDENPKTDP